MLILLMICRNYILNFAYHIISIVQKEYLIHIILLTFYIVGIPTYKVQIIMFNIMTKPILCLVLLLKINQC